MNRHRHPSTRLHSDSKDGPVRNLDRAFFRASVWSLDQTFYRLIAIAVALMVISGPSPARAQPGNAKKGVVKKAEKPKVAPKAEEIKVDDPDALPPGYQPPPPPLAIMDLEAPLATKEELNRLNKDYVGKFSKVKLEAKVDAESLKIIEGFVRYRLAYMTTLPKDSREDKKDTQEKLPALHRSFLTEISTAGLAKNPAQVTAITNAIGKEVCKQMPELLKNNFYVRLHSVMILGEMDFAPAHELLLQVIQAKDINEDPDNGQPMAIKVAATNGLIRLLTFANPTPTVKERMTIAHAVIGELANNKVLAWYQVRLIEVLRTLDIGGVEAGDNNRPFVVEALLAIIRDKDRIPYVRAKACYAIGRVPIPAGVNANDVVAAVSDFALQLATAAAAQPNNPMWKSCFWDIYLAFHAFNTKDQDAEKKRAGGLLAVTSMKSVVQPAYDVIVPIVNDILSGKAPSAANLDKLKAFVKPK